MVRINEQLRELDRIAKMLVRRDFELLQTNEAMRLLDETKAKDEALLASIGDGMIAVDKDERIMTINKSTEMMLGCGAQDLMGKKWLSIMRVENEGGSVVPKDELPIRLVLSHGKKITNSSYYYIRADKTRFPVAITAAPVVLEGKIIGAIVIFRDITREKEIDRAKSEFVSLASHQLRTPLTAINWYIEMLLRGEVGDIGKRQKGYLKKIYNNSRRMMELVNALLNASRVELGTLAIKTKPINFIEIANSVLEELAPQIKKKGLLVKKIYDKNLPIINADPQLMRIVFQNLLSNSVKYTQDSGTISLTIEKQDPDILIKVSDNGYGIPKRDQSQIFKKLFRADNIREKDPNGTGLGLYIVKAVVEQSGGKIWFESPTFVGKIPAYAEAVARKSVSKKENKGTTFYVTIPLEGMNPVRGKTTLASVVSLG